MPPHSEDDIRIGALRLRVRHYGDPLGAPVVMLHGGALMGSTWRRVCERLPTYHCIMPDMRGHGDSDWASADGYDLESFAGDLAGLIAAYELDRPHLVGMSLGGQASLYAVCHGLAVRSLCLVDVGPTLARRGARAINSFVDQVHYPSFEAALDAAAAFNPRRNRASLAASLKRSMREDADGRWAWKWDPARLPGRGSRADQAEALWPLLDRVRCPALIVRGAESPVFTADLAERFAIALPDATLATVPDAGHSVQTDQPAFLAELLGAFWAAADTAAVAECH